MRLIVVLFCFLFVAQASNAQTPTVPPPAPELELVKFSWSKERLDWERSPFGGPNENFHQMQFRARAEKRVSDAKRSNSPEMSKIEKEAKADIAIAAADNQNSKPPRYYFFYRASVRNTSTKAIKEIDWDYVFLDAVSGDELDRRQFTSVQNIGPGRQNSTTMSLIACAPFRIEVAAIIAPCYVGVNLQGRHFPTAAPAIFSWLAVRLEDISQANDDATVTTIRTPLVKEVG